MKSTFPKFSLAIPGILFLANLFGLRADEGFWLFSDPPRQLLKDKYGFDLTASWLEHLQKATVVLKTGGSGAFVSPLRSGGRGSLR